MTTEGAGPPGVTVRPADAGETGDAAAVLDGALLDYPEGAVEAAVDRGDCLVAVERRVVGACLLDPREEAVHVVAIAVRRPERGRGIGRALVERAGERGRLTAAFRPAVRAFYEACGFRIEDHPDPAVRGGGERRLWGVRE